MKKQINLYFDFEFTSLSSDAQPISLGIVSDEIGANAPTDTIKECCDGELKLKNHKKLVDNGFGLNEYKSKSFYAEFSDFDINRCDDWVKENVVSKLRFPVEVWGKNAFQESESELGSYLGVGCFEAVKKMLAKWLSQFSDYQIQFISDCGTWDWYWMLQLLGEWETSSETVAYAEDETFMSYPDKVKNLYNIMDKTKGRPIRIMHHAPSLPTCDFSKGIGTCTIYMDKSPVQIVTRVGLPKLPANISPVPQDLNDLIAFKKGITVLEAFNTSREELALGHHSEGLLKRMKGLDNYMENKLALDPINGEKHNALWDAKIIKKCYQKLTQ